MHFEDTGHGAEGEGRGGEWFGKDTDCHNGVAMNTMSEQELAEEAEEEAAEWALECGRTLQQMDM